MKISVNLDSKEEEMLKQFAALQFPGSIENIGISRPIHFLEARSNELGCMVSLDKINPGDDGYIFVDTEDGSKYNSLDDIVTHILMEYDGYEEEEKLEGYVSFNECEGNAYEFVRDFFAGLECRIQAYADVEKWNYMGVAFTRQNLHKVEKELSNHIFGETAIYSYCGEKFGRDAGDFNTMYSILFQMGENLLLEEAKNWETVDKFLPIQKGAKEYEICSCVIQHKALKESLKLSVYRMTGKYGERILQVRVEDENGVSVYPYPFTDEEKEAETLKIPAGKDNLSGWMQLYYFVSYYEP